MQKQDILDYMDKEVDSFNKLITEIPYAPAFYNYITKYQLKSIQMQLKSEEFLPCILINEKLSHKIKYHKTFKQAYGLTNCFQFESTLSVDMISYDVEESYKEKLESDNMYPILLNFSTGNQDWSIESITNFFQQKACSYSTNSIDLLYLNLFKICFYSHNQNFTTFLYYPSLKFRLQEIRHTNKFVETPLTRMITKSRSSQKKERPEYKFGFLSLDQSNRIFPLMSQDPLIMQLPLIGAWLYSNDPYDEPLNNRQYIWSMLAEFTCSPYIKQRICKDHQDQFLFIQFQKNQSPQFFEVSILEDPHYKIVRQQEKVLNIDNHQIDLASAMPFGHIEKISDLYSKKSPTGTKSKSRHSPEQKQKCKPLELVQTIEQSFQHESSIKQPPVPIPQPLDSNSSYQSANFPQNSQLTERLVIMQSEQLKLMQTQIIDLQRALLQQMQKSAQQPMSPPRNEQTFQPSNKRAGLPVQKIDFLSEQLKLKTQSKRKHQEIEEIAQQIVCDKFESLQNSTRNSINKLASQSNSHTSDTPGQNRVSTNKKQSLGDLIVSMRESEIKRQIKRNQTMIQDLNGNCYYDGLQQKPQTTNHSSGKHQTQSLSPFQQQQQVSNFQCPPIQSPTFNFTNPYQDTFSTKNSQMTYQDQEHVRIDQFQQQLLQQQQIQYQQQQSQKKQQQSNLKQSVQMSIQKSQQFNKENIVMNQLEQSAGSKAMPKIKFNLKDYEDSESDEEIKKLQMKYLKKR